MYADGEKKEKGKWRILYCVVLLCGNNRCGRVCGQAFYGRRGKWLLFELIDDYLIIHFRMEGRFYLLDKNSERARHDYVVFEFDDFSLHYNDSRLFGKMEIVSKNDLEKFFDDKQHKLEERHQHDLIRDER